MAALLAPKKLLAQHVAYLYNVVLLPRLEFRLQTSLFSEPTVQSIISPMLSLLKKKAGLASTTPLALLYLKVPFSIQHAFCRFLSLHVASWQKIFTHPDFRGFADYAISYLQGFLGAESCPTAIDLTPWSQLSFLHLVENFFYNASPLLLDIVPDGQYRPQWALSLDRLTQALLVGRVCMSYSKKGHAIMSHWLPPSDPNSTEFTPCPGYTVAYPTKKNTKVFATGRPIKLATSFAYASSLAKIHFDRLSNPILPSSDIDDIEVSAYMLPSSTCTLYTDGSFLASRSGSLPSMSSAWLALDEDDFILESCSEVIPTTYFSAFRSEIYALLSALKALPLHSSVVINTDCASLISFWYQYIDKPFIPKLLRQPNHLLWLSVRHYFYTKQLSVTFQKVSAHGGNMFNNQVDSLAKDAHFLLQPTLTPIALLKAPFNTFDWEGISFWLSRFKAFTTHSNGHKGLLAFRLKLLLDMLPTLTALQKRDPSSYPPDWLCALCHSAPEDLDHLWTCPYIIPDASPRLIFHKLMLSFHDKCITQFSDTSPLSDQFLLEFSALDCWDFTTPSSPCLWLARSLLPADLVHLLQQLYSRKKIFEILSSLLLEFQEQLYWDI
ncbi:unnamed protein product [Rhizophagus irregularis]|nr:unnamed protein product [Rhizophagus irregularis]